MRSGAVDAQKRIDSLRIRIDSLASLRKLVALPAESDIAKQQWAVLEPQLATTQARLLERLKRAGNTYLAGADRAEDARRLNTLLGEIELDTSTAFNFFDTYVDVLTQRHGSELGPLLAGCDVLAWDALRRDHPALAVVELPLVYCDRGFGASIVRESVRFPDGTANPMPLIQIPYSRLKQKYNLTSILHEAGHQALVRLGLVTAIPTCLQAALARAGAGRQLQDLFALWALEIGPDFWTFCLAGSAEAAGVRDLLSLPPSHVFRISWTDPHPPPYLRVLLSLEWCRQVWGQGVWDGWERQWKALYPLDGLAPRTRALIVRAAACLPIVGRALLTTRFRALGQRTIPDQFDLRMLHPERLGARAATVGSASLDLRGRSPCAQLAAFRVLRDQGPYTEETIDSLMTRWLTALGRTREALLSNRPVRQRGGDRDAG
jgi:hypothetical protein